MKKQSPIIKGMLFAGCSFTWGQGLYYYSNMTTLKEPPPNCYDPALLEDTHVKYMETLRFPRLVANHFNTYELCQPFNGGASYSIHDWWRRCFMNKDDPEKTKGNHPCPVPTYNYEDVGHVFYQFTQWHRSQSITTLGKPYKTTHSDIMQQSEFAKWLVDNNITVDQYIDHAIKKDLKDAREFLQPFIDRGIKVYVMSWPRALVDYIKQDTWFDDKFIEFNYKNIHYPSIEHMMQDTGHPELTIYSDTEEFEVTPQDMHPSKTCHRVIADNIIKHLERKI